MSGNSPWTVVLWNGRPVRVEIETEGRTLVIGVRNYDGHCARCGTWIRVSTPNNDEMDCCEACEDAIEQEVRAENEELGR